jgi:hypothetical protein
MKFITWILTGFNIEMRKDVLSLHKSFVNLGVLSQTINVQTNLWFDLNLAQCPYNLALLWILGLTF